MEPMKLVVYFDGRTIFSSAVRQYARELKQDFPSINFDLVAKFLNEDFVDEDLIPYVDANYHMCGYPVVLKDDEYFGGLSELYDLFNRLKVIAQVNKTV